jgi:ryanodine receptor 2
MQPSMLLKLLRKLTVDVSNLSEYTTVALRVCRNQLNHNTW